TLTPKHKLAALAVAAAIGGGAGAGAYAAASGGSSAPAMPGVAAQPASVAATSLSISEIAKASSPGVVDVPVASAASAFGRESQGEGSGFVLDKAGHIVTNEHVIDGAASITVHFEDGTKATASVVGSDPSSDIAVLKVDVDASELTPLALGSSSSVT